jgi:hypothetical protein
LHDAVERREVARVVPDGGIEHDVPYVGEYRRWRTGGLRQRIDLDFPAVGDRIADIGIAVAFQV